MAGGPRRMVRLLLQFRMDQQYVTLAYTQHCALTSTNRHRDIPKLLRNDPPAGVLPQHDILDPFAASLLHVRYGIPLRFVSNHPVLI